MRDPSRMRESELERRINAGYSFLEVCPPDIADKVKRRIHELELILALTRKRNSEIKFEFSHKSDKYTETFSNG